MTTEASTEPVETPTNDEVFTSLIKQSLTDLEGRYPEDLARSIGLSTMRRLFWDLAPEAGLLLDEELQTQRLRELLVSAREQARQQDARLSAALDELEQHHTQRRSALSAALQQRTDERAETATDDDPPAAGEQAG